MSDDRNGTGPADRNGARRELFGLHLDAMTRPEAVDRCLRAVKDGERLEVGVLNAAKVVWLRRDGRLRTCLNSCGLLLADGQSVVWASRMLRRPLPERVAGIDLFQDLLAQAASRRIPVYLLGARSAVVDRAVEEARHRYPGLVFAGYRDGYFADHQAGPIADEIRRSGAQLLFLGMSSPKKEEFCARYAARTGAAVVHGVGGSIDILAGLTRRAPERWQRLGLEWLYRTVQEPRRMGPRYLRTNLAFFGIVAREVLRNVGAGLSRRRVGRRRPEPG
jgi:N-acetylglucosaminyldiphosphoundecaprenol N-acetyl-beta-D-mannosaminyltransferase